jgi:hypothetical protein
VFLSFLLKTIMMEFSLSTTEYLLLLLLAVALCSFGLIIYRLYFHSLAKSQVPNLLLPQNGTSFTSISLRAQADSSCLRPIECMSSMARLSESIQMSYTSKIQNYDTLYRAGSAVRDTYPPSCLFAGTPLGTFGTVKHKPHRARKAPLATYFSKRVYRTAEPNFQSQMDSFSSRLRKRHIEGKVTDVRVDFLSTTTEIVSLYAFSHPIGLHDSPEEAQG